MHQNVTRSSDILMPNQILQHCWVRRRRRLLAIRAWGGAQERTDILRFHTKKSPLASDVDLSELAALSSGYTGADLAAVCRQACMHALISGDVWHSMLQPSTVYQG